MEESLDVTGRQIFMILFGHHEADRTELSFKTHQFSSDLCSVGKNPAVIFIFLPR